MTDVEVPRQSRRSIRWGLVATVLWSAALLGGFDLVGGLLIKVLARFARSGLASAQVHAMLTDDVTLRLAATSLVMLLGCACVIAIIRLKKGASLREYLALRRVRIGVLLRWIGALLLFLVVEAILFGILGKRDKLFVDNLFSSVPMWLSLATVLVIAPLFEELTFRGFIFAGLESSIVRTWGAIVITAGLWAFFHPQYTAFGVAVVFALGLLFGVARFRSGSLIVPLALHSLHNLSAFGLYTLGR